jgi:hypothetical protein
MSQLKNEDNSQTQSEVADDWENVGDEQVMAQIAERQKQLVEQKNEVEQLKLPEADDGQQPGPANSIGDRPFRLLRRPQSASRLGKDDKDGSSNENKAMTLEERQAAYEQARERIFGEKRCVEESPADEFTPSQDTSAGPIVEPLLPDPRRNHLSDVPMKTSNIAPSRWPPCVPPPPPQSLWTPVPPLALSSVPAYLPPSSMYMPPQSAYATPPPPFHLNEYGGGFPSMAGQQVIPVTTAPIFHHHPMMGGPYALPPQIPNAPQPLSSVNAPPPLPLQQQAARVGSYAAAITAPRPLNPKGARTMNMPRQNQTPPNVNGGRSPQRPAFNDAVRFPQNFGHPNMYNTAQYPPSTYGRPPQHLMAGGAPQVVQQPPVNTQKL